MVHIGNLIRKVSREKQITVVEFAAMADVNSRTMYRILRRESIDSAELNRYAHILDHDFFRDLSDAVRIELEN